LADRLIANLNSFMRRPPQMAAFLLRFERPAISGAFRERILHPLHGRMAPVLHLDPIRRSAGPIWSIASLRHQALQAEFASGMEQVGTDLALFVRRSKAPPEPLQPW
jgi:hypothetical protein